MAYDSQERQEHWRQENPRDQVRVILGAAEGNLSNLREGIAKDPKITMQRIADLLRDAQDILKNMPEGQWKKD